MIRSFDSTTWSLRAKQFSFSGTDILGNGAERLVDFQSHTKSIYLPESDWIQFANKINSLYQAQSLPAFCDKQTGLCSMKKTCDEFDQVGSFKLNMTLYDQKYGATDNSKPITIDTTKMLIDDSAFAGYDLCYLPIYKIDPSRFFHKN